MKERINAVIKEAELPSSIHTGRDFYYALANKLGGETNASLYLNSIGIGGHHFPAAGGSQARFPNYVTYFDPEIVRHNIGSGRRLHDKNNP